MQAAKAIKKTTCTTIHLLKILEITNYFVMIETKISGA